jgi:hypothetical protein
VGLTDSDDEMDFLPECNAFEPQDLAAFHKLPECGIAAVVGGFLTTTMPVTAMASMGAREVEAVAGSAAAALRAMAGVEAVVKAVECWEVAHRELQGHGMPPLHKLCCCKKACGARLLLENPAKFMNIVATTKLLRERSPPPPPRPPTASGIQSLG